MNSDVSKNPNPDGNSSWIDERKEDVGEKKSLSSTDDGDEWVLVGPPSIDLDETAACHRSDVDTTAVFENSALPGHGDAAAAIAMLVNITPASCAHFTTVEPPANREDTEQKCKDRSGVAAEVPPTTTSAAAAVVAEETANDDTVLGLTKTAVDSSDDISSQPDEKQARSNKLDGGDEETCSSSEASLLGRSEHLEEISSSMTASVATTTTTTDTGGYEVVDDDDDTDPASPPQNDYHVTGVPSPPLDHHDDLPPAPPVNFILMYSTLIRNYIHSADMFSSNWRLSLMLVVASAAVLGLGIGHFIGSAHVKISRRNNILREQAEQLVSLNDKLVDCLDRLKQAEITLEDGRARYSSHCTEGYCRAEEQPGCSASGNFEDQLADCSKRLEACQGRIRRLEAENSHSTDNTRMMNAFRDLRLLRHKLIQVYAIYERLSDVLLSERTANAENEGPKTDGAEESDQLLDSEKEELLTKLREAELREDKLVEQESELRGMLTNLDTTIGALNVELAKMKRQMTEYKDQYESCASKKQKQQTDSDGSGDEAGRNVEEDKKNDDDEEDEETNSSSELNWNLFSELLKDGAKFNKIFENYLGLFKDVKLPEIQVSKQWLEQLPASLEEAAINLKEVLDEKIQDVEHTLYTTDWDGYVKKAKDATAQMGDAVGTLWNKAKDLTDQIHEQHAEHGEKVLNDIKTTAQKAAEVFDKQWAQAINFWRDLAGTVNLDEDLELENEEKDIEEEANEEELDQTTNSADGDENSNGAVLLEDLAPPTIELEEDHEEEAYEPEFVDHWTSKGDDKVLVQDNDKTDWRYDEKDATTGSEEEIAQLREALKSSNSFSRYVTDEFADHYFQRLKHAAASISSSAESPPHVDDTASWWTCQKLWWAGHSTAYGRKCSDKLTTWQRHHATDDYDMRRELVNRAPALIALVKRFAADHDGGEDSATNKKKRDGDGNGNRGTNWVFDVAKNHQDIRKQQERKENSNNWLHKRWRNRDKMRNQQQQIRTGIFNDEDVWLFRRGSERQKSRNEESRNRQQKKVDETGRRSEAKYYPKKQHQQQSRGGKHSQNRRR